MIKQLIEDYGPLVECPDDLDGSCILYALYRCEKYNKYNKVPRFESAYAPGGIYYRNAAHVRAAYDTWGRSAACSYSNFQILFVTAQELGYNGPPLALDKDSIAIPYVVRYLNKRIFARGAKELKHIADAYNSGSFRDGIVPEKYIGKFIRFYKEAKKACQPK